jgi:hypothetical protein
MILSYMNYVFSDENNTYGRTERDSKSAFHQQLTGRGKYSVRAVWVLCGHHPLLTLCC